MFRRLFGAYVNTTITSAAIIVGALSLVSRVLGLLRDRVLAGEFGADAVLDTYYAAFRIPDLIFNLLVIGALSAGFIPIFTRLFADDRSVGRHAAWQLVSNLLNTGAVVVALISAALYVWSLPLTRLFAPGFAPAQLRETAALTRIMLLSPMLLGISAVFGGVLQSLKQFFIFSLAPILYNVGIICGALFLVPRIGIRGLAWGVVLGAGLHLLIQLPAVVASGYRHRWLIDIGDRQLGQLLRLMWPRTLSLAIGQLNLAVVTIMASWLSAGSLAVFNFANNLQSFPLGIFGLSFAIAAFPTLAELAAVKDRFVTVLSQTLRQILFLIIPSSALLILLRAQVVRALLGSGRFDWNDTVATMETLAIFSISLFAQALVPLLMRAFYAQRDSVTPLLTALGSALLNITLAVALVGPLGIAGLALAVSTSNVLQLAVLWLILRLRLNGLDESQIFISTLKIAVAALLMAAVVQGSKYLTAAFSGTQTFLGIAAQGVTSAGAGLVTYLLVCLALRSPEALAMLEMLRPRRPRPVSVGEVVSDSTPT